MWLSTIKGNYLPETRYQIHQLVSKGFKSPNGSNHRSNHDILFKAIRDRVTVQSTTEPDWLRIRETVEVEEISPALIPIRFSVETIPVTRGQTEKAVDGEDNQLLWFINNITKHGGKLTEVDTKNNVFYGTGLFTVEQQEQGIGKQRHLGYGLILNKGTAQ